MPGGGKMEFEGRVAILTGGSGALGTAVALDLLAAGARVAIPYVVDAEWAALEARAAERKKNLYGAKADITRSEAVQAFAHEVSAHWAPADFLVCVAGGFAAGRSWEADDAAWSRMLDLNLRSVVFALRAVVPAMIERNFGRIVTVSSGSILRGGGAGIAPYAVSKGAVLQLSEILADELRERDILVRCILPGTMDTEANRRAMPKADFSKWVAVEDVARVIHALLSEDFRAVRSVAVPVLG